MFEIQINISSSLGTADRPETVVRAVYQKKHGDVALSTEWSWPVAQLAHGAFKSRRVHHQFHLRNGSQQSLDPAMRRPEIVRHTEGATRGTFFLVHRVGGLKNEGVTEAIE